jgi:microcystin-dependent protein
VLCNGNNGTPDLRDRFIVGAGTTYAVNATGGSTDAIVVSHTHTGSTASAGDHSHFVASSSAASARQFTTNVTSGNYVSAQNGESGLNESYNLSATDSVSNIGLSSTAGAHTHTVTINSAGASGTNANLPPYYALCYIMKT